MPAQDPIEVELELDHGPYLAFGVESRIHLGQEIDLAVQTLRSVGIRAVQGQAPGAALPTRLVDLPTRPVGTGCRAFGGARSPWRPSHRFYVTARSRWPGSGSNPSPSKTPRTRPPRPWAPGCKGSRSWSRSTGSAASPPSGARSALSEAVLATTGFESAPTRTRGKAQFLTAWASVVTPGAGGCPKIQRPQPVAKSG